MRVEANDCVLVFPLSQPKISVIRLYGNVKVWVKRFYVLV